MVSIAHEIPVELFKNRPTLAAELLVESFGVDMPMVEEAKLAFTPTS